MNFGWQDLELLKDGRLHSLGQSIFIAALQLCYTAASFVQVALEVRHLLQLFHDCPPLRLIPLTCEVLFVNHLDSVDEVGATRALIVIPFSYICQVVDVHDCWRFTHYG